MTIATKFMGTVASALMFATFMVTPVGATASTTQTTTQECAVKMTGKTNTVGQADSRWTTDGNGTYTGTFKVTGPDTCTQTVTIAAWEAPNAEDGKPYDKQKLVSHETMTFAVGTHTMSIKAPNCYFQLDMVRGVNATGPTGTAQYTVGSLLGSLHGGTKVCETPVTPQTPATPVQPAALPNTGVGTNVLITAAAVAVLGTVAGYYRRLRALQ